MAMYLQNEFTDQNCSDIKLLKIKCKIKKKTIKTSVFHETLIVSNSNSKVKLEIFLY